MSNQTQEFLALYSEEQRKVLETVKESLLADPAALERQAQQEKGE